MNDAIMLPSRRGFLGSLAFGAAGSRPAVNSPRS